LVPGFAYFAAWYLLGALAFWLIGMETRGRTIEEIDAQMSRGVAPTPRPARVAAEQTRVLSMANGRSRAGCFFGPRGAAKVVRAGGGF
jgi:hypothetical protein